MSYHSVAFLENIKAITFAAILLAKLDSKTCTPFFKAEWFVVYKDFVQQSLSPSRNKETEYYWRTIIKRGGKALIDLVGIYGCSILLFPTIFPWRKLGEMSAKDIDSVIKDKEFWKEYIDMIKDVPDSKQPVLIRNLDYWFKDIVMTIKKAPKKKKHYRLEVYSPQPEQ